MPKKSLLNYIGIALAVLGLLLIRFYESSLFYDPFLAYYAYDYLHADYPAFDLLPLLLHYALRFVVTASLSLVILRFWFGATPYWNIIWKSFVVLGIAVLFFLLLLLTILPQAPMLLFYVRRFAIQPIWLLLCMGALFYFNWQTPKVQS